MAEREESYMSTKTFYCINEKDCSINFVQYNDNKYKKPYEAIMNAKTYTFDELVTQHDNFCKYIEPYESFKEKLNIALRIKRSIPVDVDDMLARFTAEHGENIFFQGYVLSIIDYYDKKREDILRPNDFPSSLINRRKLQDTISKELNQFINTKFNLMCKDAYFNHNANIKRIITVTKETTIAADDNSFSVFHESDTCLLTILAEIGQLVHRNKWMIRKCEVCKKQFLGLESDVCCHSNECINTLKDNKKAIYNENSKKYSDIKRDYDSYVRRYKKELDDISIDKKYPLDYDEFIQAQEERKKKMEGLKKHLIQYGLPTTELEHLSAQLKGEIRCIAREILERCKK